MKVLITTPQLENIVGEVFYPPGHHTQKREVVIVNSAYGVPKEFYYPFANYLSEQGLTVLSYDYLSLEEPESFSLTDQEKIERCGQLDFETVIQWVEEFFPDQEIHVIGHGIGGSIIGFAPSCKKIKDIISIGARLSSRFDWPKNHLLLKFLSKKIIENIKSFFSKVTYLNLRDLQSSSSQYNNRWSLRSRSKDLSRDGLMRATYAQQFTGRLLTIRLHDDVYHYPENDPIQNSFSHAKKNVRNLYPTDLEVVHLGFFGLFNKFENNALWSMCNGWICDTIIVKDYPYAIFEDSEFPLVKIFISDREPSAEIGEEYLKNMGDRLRKGPIYILIDLTSVQWADSGMAKYISPWLAENRELIINMHKYTVYVAPNTFIRYFLIFFHLIAFNNIIKPVQIFKDYDTGLNWLRHQVESDKKIRRIHLEEKNKVA